MQRLSAGVLVVFGAGVLTGMGWLTRADSRRSIDAVDCGVASAAQVRTTLYFGLNRPTGTVSELEWQLFLRDEVTPRFPYGLTVWDAQGHWLSRGTTSQERSKVLLLVHADSPDAQAAVQAVIARYRGAFEQESVLWETARVCAAS